MKATCTLVKKRALDILIERGDKNAINELIKAVDLDLQQLKKISEIDLEYRKSQSKERIERLKRRMSEQRSRIEEFDRIRGAHLKLIACTGKKTKACVDLKEYNRHII